MRIGIVSDTHGEADRLRSALAIFRAHDAEAIVHCGDLGTTKCLRILAAAGSAVYMVAGNMDRHVEELVALADELSVHFAWEVIEVPLGNGRRLVATHGHDGKILGELVHDAQFPYVCFGHTHRMLDERHGSVHVINPGALHNVHTPTVALLDTATDTVEHVVVP